MNTEDLLIFMAAHQKENKMLPKNIVASVKLIQNGKHWTSQGQLIQIPLLLGDTDEIKYYYFNWSPTHNDKVM